jgi:quercetin dioxygenase-like cupin family protein
MSVADNWYAGNAADDAPAHRGWILGHFIDPGSAPVRVTQALEIKWGTHSAGEQRAAWTSGEDRSTLVILVSGRFRVDLAVGSTTLERQGDYITWGPGIDHSWQAEERSVVITVRWPSAPEVPKSAAESR